MFSCEFCGICKNNISYRTLPVADSHRMSQMFDRILNTPLGNFVFYLDFEVDYDVKIGHYVSGKNDNNVSTKEIKIGKANFKIKVNN